MKELESGDRLVAEAKERAEKATPGPWYIHWGSVYAYIKSSVNDWFILDHGYAAGAYVRHDGDADFLAHSRTDVPSLCAEVEMRGRAIRYLLDERHKGCAPGMCAQARNIAQVAAILAGEEKP